MTIGNISPIGYKVQLSSTIALHTLITQNRVWNKQASNPRQINANRYKNDSAYRIDHRAAESRDDLPNTQAGDGGNKPGLRSGH
ncbi:MAG: hypothetical protein V4858_14985 [Pseudomonadota bacterium]